MLYAVNLAQGSDAEACAAVLAQYGMVLECGSGRTCHLKFIEMNPFDLSELSKALGPNLHSIVPASAAGSLVGGLWYLENIPGPIAGDGSGAYVLSVDAPVEHSAELSNLVKVYQPFSFGSVQHGQNTMGMAVGQTHGIAPGATGLACAGFDGNGFGTVAMVLQAWTAGLDYVEDNNLGPQTVMYNSYTFSVDAFDASVARAKGLGMTVIAAAGNSAINLDSSALVFPAKTDGVLPVAAHAEDGTRPTWSNWKPGILHAPGVTVEVADLSGVHLDGGTSFSAPFVGGLAAVHIGNGEAYPEVRIFEDAQESAPGVLAAVVPTGGVIELDGGDAFTEDYTFEIDGGDASTIYAPTRVLENADV